MVRKGPAFYATLYQEVFFAIQEGVLKKKEDVNYVDFNVTVSNDGTSKYPKFQLKTFFKKCLFPIIEKLVCDGGHFEGFAPVIQGENAVPHQDVKLYKYVVNLCKAKKWMWETQGPQMPHMNVMDISEFPEMPRHRSHLIRYLRGGRFSKDYDIW